MKKGNLIIPIILMGLGVAIAISSYQMKLGGLNNPGPGMYSFFLGITLSVCCVPMILRSILDAGRTMQEITNVWDKTNIKKVGLVLFCLVGYALLLEKSGYLLTTFIIFSILFKMMGFSRLRTILMVSFLTVAISYLVFSILLEVPLPKGIWRIG